MYINNIFNQDQIQSILDQLDTIEPETDEIHGRTLFHGFKLDRDARKTITDIVRKEFGDELVMTVASVTEYNNIYGTPELNPHFDGDDTLVIVDYQLQSNVVWPLGVDTATYPLEDNCAVAFSPNDNIHWRPHREFQDGEFVRMMFFRFLDPSNIVVRDEKRLSQTDPIFDEVKAYRDSL